MVNVKLGKIDETAHTIGFTYSDKTEEVTVDMTTEQQTAILDMTVLEMKPYIQGTAELLDTPVEVIDVLAKTGYDSIEVI